MITYEKVLVLKNIPFFAEASELALSDLIAVCEEHTVKTGDIIVHEGEENKYLFMILLGNAHVIDRDGVLIAEVGARQVFGETTVMSPAILPYRVVAQTQTTFLRVSGDQLYRMMALHPSLAQGFIGELSKRLRQLQIKNI
ncbi:MAG: Crp/Fnr family transcriptional regulator [Alphaproteobacteria bacterium]|nr:Crp/Fnr family transcriptional regulator [Alphaproteobacteria bacterium]